MGKICKIILQDICSELRTALNINQSHSTKDCIKWLRDYDKNDKCSFIKYIRDFYPSITEKAVDGVLKLVKEYIEISDDKLDIKHWRKSILNHNEELWLKKGVVILIITWVHSMYIAIWILSGAYCYITSIASLTPVTMGFMEMMDWLSSITVRLEKVI